MNTLISTKEAAAKLRISVRRVQALISAGRLPAAKIGNSFVIKESDLRVLNGRKSGRPANGSKREEKDWDSILDRFIGCIKDGPADLSTNPKYMEGFGRDRSSRG